MKALAVNEAALGFVTEKRSDAKTRRWMAQP